MAAFDYFRLLYYCVFFRLYILALSHSHSKDSIAQSSKNQGGNQIKKPYTSSLCLGEVPTDSVVPTI